MRISLAALISRVRPVPVRFDEEGGCLIVRLAVVGQRAILGTRSEHNVGVYLLHGIGHAPLLHECSLLSPQVLYSRRAEW